MEFKSNQGIERFKSEKPKLIVPIGLPGCGKTSHRKDDCVILCKDDLRFMLLNTSKTKNDFETSLEHIVESSRRYMFFNLITERFNIDLDSTNLKLSDRLYYLQIAFAFGYEIHYIYFENVKQAINNNKNRERMVPMELIKEMITEMEFPNNAEINRFKVKLENIEIINERCLNE